MTYRKTSKGLVFFIAITVLMTTACGNGPAPTRAQIVSTYPDVEVGSSRAENPEIMCPFVRMLERSGLFDVDGSPLAIVPTATVGFAAKEFGCLTSACQTVAGIAAAAQSAGGVDILNLHAAGSISHAKCGLTFDPDATQISDTARQATLDRLAELADVDGHLVYNDILTAKTEICTAQGVAMSGAGETEIKLVYAYLGGTENGFVTHSDVARLLNATMPETKTSGWISLSSTNF